jgi:hypothetical protein
MEFGKFYISFETRDMPGIIKATRVEIALDFIREDKFNTQRFAINLCDHPLYPQLVAYVNANPIRKQK